MLIREYNILLLLPLLSSVRETILLLLLRDLAAGRIPVGYGANRGLGTVRLRSVSFDGHDLEHLPKSYRVLASLSGTTLEAAGDRLDLAARDGGEIPTGVMELLQDAWRVSLGLTDDRTGGER